MSNAQAAQYLLRNKRVTPTTCFLHSEPSRRWRERTVDEQISKGRGSEHTSTLHTYPVKGRKVVGLCLQRPHAGKARR